MSEYPPQPGPSQGHPAWLPPPAPWGPPPPAPRPPKFSRGFWVAVGLAVVAVVLATAGLIGEAVWNSAHSSGSSSSSSTATTPLGCQVTRDYEGSGYSQNSDVGCAHRALIARICNADSAGLVGQPVQVLGRSQPDVQYLTSSGELQAIVAFELKASGQGPQISRVQITCYTGNFDSMVLLASEYQTVLDPGTVLPPRLR